MRVKFRFLGRTTLLVLLLFSFNIKAQNTDKQLEGTWNLTSIEQQQLDNQGIMKNSTKAEVSDTTTLKKFSSDIIAYLGFYQNSLGVMFTKGSMNDLQPGKASFSTTGNQLTIYIYGKDPLVFNYYITETKLTLIQSDEANLRRNMLVYKKTE